MTYNMEEKDEYSDIDAIIQEKQNYVNSMTPEEQAEQDRIQASVVVTTSSPQPQATQEKQTICRVKGCNGHCLTAIETATKEEAGKWEQGWVDELNARTATALKEERERIAGEVERMKRTDETQMNDDHVYDEALDDVLSIIEGDELIEKPI
jgi:hypothetical protein